MTSRKIPTRVAYTLSLGESALRGLGAMENRCEGRGRGDGSRRERATNTITRFDT